MTFTGCGSRNGFNSVSAFWHSDVSMDQRRRIAVNFCPLTKFDGGLLRLHEAGEAAVDWLTTYGSWHTLIIIIWLVINVHR